MTLLTFLVTNVLSFSFPDSVLFDFFNLKCFKIWALMLNSLSFVSSIFYEQNEIKNRVILLLLLTLLSETFSRRSIQWWGDGNFFHLHISQFCVKWLKMKTPHLLELLPSNRRYSDWLTWMLRLLLRHLKAKHIFYFNLLNIALTCI